MLKYAIIGFGGLGKAHFRNTKELSEKVEDIRLVAICDIDESTFTTQRNINISSDDTKLDLTPYNLYTDVNELFEKEQLDFIITALPTFIHEKIAVMAMERGIHVFSEKPMAINVEQAQNMIDKAKENNVKLMIGHCVRYFPEYYVLKNIIDSKRYGEVLYGNFVRLSAIPKWSWENWFRDEKLSGGVLLDMHVHDVDFISWAFGKPKSVSTKSISYLMAHETAVTEYGYDGKIITSTTSWGMADSYPFTATYLVRFEKATIECKGGTTTIYTNDAAEQIDPEKENFDQPSTNGYVNEVIDFINCIRNNCESKINTPETAKLSLEIAFAEKKSAQSKETVLL
ncbi:MAG: Gfo/Idh/MocA family oxidoreductase [Clostridia bacterium]|nr:Gfo/Idh/MocA family oxidoreductase [Clostridia bacterium]